MPEDFDLPIDGDFERPEDIEPVPDEPNAPRAKRRRVTAAHRARTSRASAGARARAKRVHARRGFEDAPSAHRPRISIDAATHAPRRVNVYRRLAVSFLTATVLVVGVIGFFTFQHTTITIAQNAIPVSATFGVQIQTGDTSGAASNVFSGVITSLTTSTEQVFTPTATSDKPGKAAGVITVQNNTGAAQPLVATTRFVYETGVLFRAVHAVTVPAHGSADVDVAADKPGAEGDVSPGKFTIPGLSAGQQKVIFGTSSAAMIGGSSKVGVVSQQDIDSATEKTRKALLEIGQNVLTAVQAPDGDEVLYTTTNITATASAKPNDAVAQFRVVATGTLAAVAYPKAQVYAAADHEVQNKAPTPYHTVIFDSNAPVVSLQSIDVDKKIASLQLYREGRAVLDEHAAAFQPIQFLGRTRQEISDQIKSIQGVTSVDVSFFPFWLDRAPNVPSRIDVKIK